MKNVIQRILAKVGIKVLRLNNYIELIKTQDELIYVKDFSQFREFLRDSQIPVEFARAALEYFPKSSAQLHQDLIALITTKFKTGGYFVEFGATDGIRFSNTYLLENTFGWTGILAEPGKSWHGQLAQNRLARIDTRCVWVNSGERLSFNETEVGELSTLDMFSSGDLHASSRVKGSKYLVETISLEDLLEQNQAPTYIDYLSIDTEGSEFSILRNFNFEKYSFGFISVEHNYTENRKNVFELLVSHGYVRVFESTSLFDDWYINESLVKAKGLI